MTGQEMRAAAIKSAASKADSVQLSAAFAITPGQWDEAALMADQEKPVVDPPAGRKL